MGSMPRLGGALTGRGAMTWLVNYVLRRLLVLLKVEDYIDGITSANFDVQAVDGWIPEQVEVTGPLRIKPGLFSKQVSLDSPASVELAEGGQIERIVVRVPPWVRWSLMKCMWRRDTSSREPSARDTGTGVKASSGKQTSLPDLPSDSHCPSPRSPSSPNSHVERLLRRPVPPEPLHLPRADSEECTELHHDDTQDEAESDTLEPVVVTVHELELRLRTYSDVECERFRCDMTREALELLQKEAPKGYQSWVRGAAASEETAAAHEPSFPTPRPEMPPPDPGAPPEAGVRFPSPRLEEVLQRIKERLRVECCGAKVVIKRAEGPECIHLRADQLDIVALFRRVWDRDAELWFGGVRAEAADSHHTLEVQLTGVTGTSSSQFAGVSTTAPENEDSTTDTLILQVPSLTLTGVLPKPGAAPSRDAPQGGPGAAESSFRFSALHGCQATLKGGLGGCFSLVTVINAILAAAAACDPATLASSGGGFSELAAAWRKCRAAQAGASAEYSSDLQDSLTRPTPREGREPADDQVQSLPLALQVLLMDLHGEAALDDFPTDSRLAQMRVALCHAFADRWACVTQLAVELAGGLSLTMDTPEWQADHGTGESPTSPKRSSKRSRSMTEDTDFTTSPRRAAGGFIEASSNTVGFYFSTCGAPYNWRTTARLLLDSFVVSSSGSSRRLVTCNMAPQVSNSVLERASQQGEPVQVNFRKLVDEAAIRIETVAGCFAPFGDAGLPQTRSSHAEQPPSRTKLESSGSFRGPASGRLQAAMADARLPPGKLSVCSFLEPWLRLPDQPPRSLFVRVALDTYVRTRLWPTALLALKATVPRFFDPGLEVLTQYLDVNCLPLAAISSRITSKRVSTSFEDDRSSGLCIHIDLQDGLSAVSERSYSPLSPCSTPSGKTHSDRPDEPSVGNFRIELRNVSAHCSTPAREVRPVLRFADLIEVWSETGARGEMTLELQCIHSKLRVDLSPQLCSVVILLAQNMEAATEHWASSGFDQASPVVKASEPANTRSESYLVGLSIGYITINFCDRISPLLRLGFSVRAQAYCSFTAKAEDTGSTPERLVAALRVSEVVGEFASKKEGVWEPFLEPWSLSVDVNHTRGLGMVVEISDGCAPVEEQDMDGWVEHVVNNYRENLLTPKSLHRELLLNINAQLLRSAAYLLGELQQVISDHGVVNNDDQSGQMPVNIYAHLRQELERDAQKNLHETSISGLNLSGCDVSVWFHHGQSLRYARHQAMDTHWESHSNSSTLPDLVLDGLSDKFTGPVPLDSFVSVPTCTTMAFEITPVGPSPYREIHESMRQSTGGKHTTGKRSPISSWRRLSTLGSGTRRFHRRASQFSAESQSSCESLEASQASSSSSERPAVNSERPSAPSGKRSSPANSTGTDGGASFGFEVPVEVLLDEDAPSPERHREQVHTQEADYRSVRRSRISTISRKIWKTATRSSLASKLPGLSASPAGYDRIVRSSTLQVDETSLEKSTQLFTKIQRWPRRDILPVMPLTGGWCVVIRDPMEVQESLKDGRHESNGNNVGTHSAMSGWQRDKFVVQVLVPSPSRRLVLIASPLRIFNYTDLNVQICFSMCVHHVHSPIACNKDLCRSVTLPASLLGDAQPFDVKPLALPSSPICSTDGDPIEHVVPVDKVLSFEPPGGGDELKAWPLPTNSFCCVPIPRSFRKEQGELCFAVTTEGFKARTKPEVVARSLLDGKWSSCSCRDEHRVRSFRIKAVRQIVDKPYPVELMNIVILPAFTVVNGTPTVLGLDLWGHKTPKRLQQQHTPRATLVSSVSNSVPEVTGVKKDVLTKVDPGSASHFYDVENSTQVDLKICIPVLPPVMDDPGDWSEAITNVCATVAGRPTSRSVRVDIPLPPPLIPPTLVVTINDFIAHIGCPVWLINRSSLELHAGRAAGVFPTVAGITMLDRSFSDAKLYLQREVANPNFSAAMTARQHNKMEMFKRASNTVRVIMAGRTQSTEKEDSDMSDEAGQDVPKNFDPSLPKRIAQCSLPLPVTSRAATGHFHTRSDRTGESNYDFTVIRDPVPQLFGPHSAPATCFHVVPTVIISNTTQEDLHARQIGPATTPWKIHAGHSAPFWACKRESRWLQIQFGSSHDEASWSGDISYDTSASGVYALAVGHGEDNSDSSSTTSTSSSISTVTNRTLFSVDETTDKFVKVICVNISDAEEGVVSIRISNAPCLLIGCWACSVINVIAETDFSHGHDSGVIRHVQSVAPNVNAKSSSRAGSTGQPPKRKSTLTAEAIASIEQAANRVRNAGVDVASRMQGVAQMVVDNVVSVSELMQGHILNKPRMPVDRLPNCVPLIPGKEEPTHAFGDHNHRWGWPLRVGWFQPFRQSPPTMTVTLFWGSGTPPKGVVEASLGRSVYASTVTSSVQLVISLGRMTPIVVLRVGESTSATSGECVENLQVAVMVRIRRDARPVMEARAKELRNPTACKGGPKARHLRETHTELRACAHEWQELSRSSPDLLEITDVNLDTLEDMDVDWACGCCGEVVDVECETRKPPRQCISCSAFMRPDLETQVRPGATPRSISASTLSSIASSTSLSSSDQPETPVVSPMQSMQVVMRLRVINMSVISEQSANMPAKELFFGEIQGVNFSIKRRRGQETANISVESVRVDVQSRLVEQQQRASKCWLCRNMEKMVKKEVPRDLLETPAMIASVGTPFSADLQKSVIQPIGLKDGAGGVSRWPSLQISWDRPITDSVERHLYVKRFNIFLHQRWELILDQLCAEALLQLYDEFQNIVVGGRATGQQDGSRALKIILQSAQTDYKDKFHLPGSLIVLQVEEVLFSGLELAVWGSVVPSKLPTWSMPATLSLLLQSLALSNTLYMEGSTMILKDFLLRDYMGSLSLLQTYLKMRYRGSLLVFLTRVITSSNLMNLPHLLLTPFAVLQLLSDTLAQAIDVIDLSPLTLDQDYIEARRRRRDDEVVDSAESSLATAGGHLFNCVYGISDIIVKPGHEFRLSGISGIPRGFCCGMLSCVVKIIDELLQAIRALILALSHCCGCSFRSYSQRMIDPAAYNPRDRRDGPPERSTGGIKPRLRGKPGLRMPRLLFGESGAIVTFVRWHAEVNTLLGPEFTEGVCAVWRLSGNEDDVAHLILCATHTQLLLVDLNEGKDRYAGGTCSLKDSKTSIITTATSSRRTGFHLHGLFRRGGDDLDLRRAARAFQRQRGNNLFGLIGTEFEAGSFRDSVRVFGLRGWRSLCGPFRCLCRCARRNSEASAPVGLTRPSVVLGYWPWNELQHVHIHQVDAPKRALVVTNRISLRSMEDVDESVLEDGYGLPDTASASNLPWRSSSTMTGEGSPDSCVRTSLSRIVETETESRQKESSWLSSPVSEVRRRPCMLCIEASIGTTYWPLSGTVLSDNELNAACLGVNQVIEEFCG